MPGKMIFTRAIALRRDRSMSYLVCAGCIKKIQPPQISKQTMTGNGYKFYHELCIPEHLDEPGKLEKHHLSLLLPYVFFWAQRLFEIIKLMVN